MAKPKVVTVKRLYDLLKNEIANGNGSKKILLGTDDEGNGFRPMFYEISRTEGNVSPYTLMGVSYDDAIKNYLIIG